MTPTPAVPAATLILVRDHPAFQVLMVERHGSLKFGPGAFVFPGGKVEAQDGDPAWTDPALVWGDLEAVLRPYGVCAIRETFEEAGLLLCKDRSGRPPDAGVQRSASQARILLNEPAFRDVLSRLDLMLDLAALRPFARWITPAPSPYRYDTTFFIARAPDDQDAVSDGWETVSSAWIEPISALRLDDEGARKLMVPTRATLQTLARSSSVAEAIAATTAFTDPANRRPEEVAASSG